jgi:predicted fused transcriptional regulator/phosphomethylpyrimidine kinase
MKQKVRFFELRKDLFRFVNLIPEVNTSIVESTSVIHARVVETVAKSTWRITP